ANYSITFVKGTLAVTSAPLTITADDKTKVYGAVNPTLSASVTGFVNGDTASAVSGAAALSTAAVVGSGVGQYAVLVDGAGTLSTAIYTNPSANFASGTLTITRAVLTVTANDASREYGVADPSFSA